MKFQHKFVSPIKIKTPQKRKFPSNNLQTIHPHALPHSSLSFYKFIQQQFLGLFVSLLYVFTGKGSTKDLFNENKFAGISV